MEAKRQKVVHLSPEEHCLQRPDMYVGSVEPERRVLFRGACGWTSVTASPALVSLSNELVTNALDNVQRGGQRHIRIEWKEEDSTLVVSNDGSTLPVEQKEDGTWVPTVAFSIFQSGSNFDQEGGKKDTMYTAGRNGVGAKGCNVFAASFEVTVVNASDRKQFTQKWESNMSVCNPPVVKSTSLKTNKTSVAWKPDFSRIGGESGRGEMASICEWMAHNASLCAPSSVKVHYNGQEVKMRSPSDFCKAMGGTDGSVATDTVTHNGVEVLRVAIAAREEEGGTDVDEAGLCHAFVNSTHCCEGSHAKHILSHICSLLDERVKTKRGAGAGVHATPSFVRKHAVVVAVVLVDNEQFASQTKQCLNTPVSKYGWKWTPSSSFRTALQERTPLVDRLIRICKEKEDADAAKATKAPTSASRHPSIPKYEPALRRHTPQATLIVCEGDSAGNLVRSGLTVVGRRDYGLYPLRGKFLNARGASSKTILENKEASALLRILGIQLHTTYDASLASKLPYARLMVMSDQDVDGSHIAGLVFNFVDAVAPSLLAVRPRYLCRFATSLIRVRLPASEAGGSSTLGFYSQVEYDTWRASRIEAGKSVGTASYFKGLGTSTAAQAKEYFKSLKDNIIVFRHTGEACANALDLSFSKTRASDRKTFLVHECDPSSYVDYKREEASLDSFVRCELLPQYAIASLKRAIPSMDGLKDATRKVLFGARRMNLRGEGKSLSVANAAGKIAAMTQYHHRATAMEDTIIGMAADYAGTSNVNLLTPLGQFGTRHKHAAASAAYPKVCLNDPLQDLLFPRADDPILTYGESDGVGIEPVVYHPILCMPLVLGCKGIATGWSTDIPPFHPVDVIDATLCLLDADVSTPAWDALHATGLHLVPWYRGFGGEVIPVEDEGGDGTSPPSSFWVRGICERVGDDVHVREVPPFREVEAYKEDWSSLCADILPGERNTDETVHLVLKSCTLTVDAGLPLARALGLEKKVTYSNMHLLDETSSKLKTYSRPEDILKDHISSRIDAYRSRLAHRIRFCSQAASIASNRARFIQLVLDGVFDMRSHSNDADASRALQALGLDPDPRVAEEAGECDESNLNDQGSRSSYAYLLEMRMNSMTQSRAMRLIEEASELERQVKNAASLTPVSEWKRELSELRSVFLSSDPRYVREV